MYVARTRKHVALLFDRFTGATSAADAALELALAPPLQVRDDGEPAHALVAIGIQEGAVIPERDAAVGSAVGAKHESMRKQPGASVDRPFAADGIEPQRGYAMKHRLARLQVVQMRRRDAAHPDAGGMRIVEAGAETGMCFQLGAIGQIDHVRGDIVDRGLAVIERAGAKRSDVLAGRTKRGRAVEVGGGIGAVSYT